MVLKLKNGERNEQNFYLSLLVFKIKLFPLERQHFLQQDVTHQHWKISKFFFNKGKSILLEIFPLYERQKANIQINADFILKLSSHSLGYVIINGWNIVVKKKKKRQKRQSLRSFLGYTSTILKKPIFFFNFYLLTNLIWIYWKLWAIQSRIIIYIVVVCLNLL